MRLSLWLFFLKRTTAPDISLSETQSWIKVRQIYFKVPLSLLIKYSWGFFCKHYVPTKPTVNLQGSLKSCVYRKLCHATINKTRNFQLEECSKSGNRHVHTYIYFFVSCLFFGDFFELYEHNHCRSVIFTLETTQRWICGIAVLSKIVLF